MKRVTGIVLVLLCFLGKAQEESKNPLYYINGGISIGNLSGGQIGINLAVENRFSAQLEYSGVVRKAKATPEDYTGGLVSIFAFGTNRPVDNIHSFRILAGKISTIHSSGNTRINLKAGLSFLTYREANNFEKDQLGGLLLVPNYSWETRKIQQIGVVFKPELEHVFVNFAGYTISPYLEITSDISTVGIAFYLLMGKVWNIGQVQ